MKKDKNPTQPVDHCSSAAVDAAAGPFVAAGLVYPF